MESSVSAWISFGRLMTMTKYTRNQMKLYASHGLDIWDNTKVWPMNDEKHFQLTSQSNAQSTQWMKKALKIWGKHNKFNVLLLPFEAVAVFSSMINTNSLAYRFECDFNKYLIGRFQAKF